MKRVKKLLVAGLALAAMFGSTITAWGSETSTYGSLEERSATTNVPTTYGGGKIYTWSQANVGASSLTLMDASIKPSYSNATIYNTMSRSGKKVIFKGDYNLTSNGWWEYSITHNYN